MKKFLSYSGILFVSLTLTLGACKKKDETTPTNNSNPKAGIVTCKVGGTVWESNSANTPVMFGDTTFGSVTATIEGDTFSLLAFRSKSADTSLIMMNLLMNTNRLGTYTMTGNDYNIFYFPSTDPLAIFAILFDYTASSSCTITKWDATNKKVSGTFTTTMTSSSGGPTYTITEGSFIDVSYTQL
ncbi:MAG: hypothetical protein JNM67_05110 [Bacteroidetes bacterium]|nr:hypothetical protein [Bacteroidota bacterium]